MAMHMRIAPAAEPMAIPAMFPRVKTTFLVAWIDWVDVTDEDGVDNTFRTEVGNVNAVVVIVVVSGTFILPTDEAGAVAEKTLIFK